MFAILVFFIALVPTTDAVDCPSCSLSQVCGGDGICYEISDLVTCNTTYYGYYCRKGQTCCGATGGCIPEGKVCCYPRHRYCEHGQTCCGHQCCVPKTICVDGTCQLNTISKIQNITRKQRTVYLTTRLKKTDPTSNVITTESTTNVWTQYLPEITSFGRRTHYLTEWTTNMFKNFSTQYSGSSNNSSTGSPFKWWFITLIVAVVLCIGVFLVLLLTMRKHVTSKGRSHCCRGIVNSELVLTDDQCSNHYILKTDGLEQEHPQIQDRNIDYI